MTASPNPSLDELLSRMRFVFFEFMWPPFSWIKSLWIRERDGTYQIFVETADAQDKEDIDDFNHLVGELLKGGEKMLDDLVSGSGHRLKHTIQYGFALPQDGGYQELMTKRVFR